MSDIKHVKKIAVMGLGKSGMAAIRFLKKRGYELLTSDSKDLGPHDAIANELKSLGVASEWGGHTTKVLDMDAILVSPGIPAELHILEQARKKGIPIWPEIEVAYHFCQGPIVAITGTNGKSTVAALTGYIMNQMGRDARVVGNIGVPLLEEIDSMTKETWAIMEVSSFQLETTEQFRPKISCITNITQDHLNRHPDVQTYLNAKERIFKNQTAKDFAVLNYDDLIVRAMGEKASAQVTWFSGNPEIDGLTLKENSVYFRQGDSVKKVAEFLRFPLLGEHNRENLLAASSICFASGLESFGKGIENFKGLLHRLEFVRSVRGVDFYDDSKGTNPDAVASALKTFQKPVVLIAGGYDKNLDFAPMVEASKGKVKALVVLAEEGSRISNAFSFLNSKDRASANQMKEAVNKAMQYARSGDVVLLSPGCASFDLFHSAEERGDEFKKVVKGFS